MIGTFAALAEPSRLRIVEALGAGPRSVGDLCDSLSLGQPQVSKHLRVLRDSGVVSAEARGQHRYYSLRPASLREVDAWLERYRGLWQERMDRMEDVLGVPRPRRKRGRHGRDRRR